jgi:small subunit ribosomal protein S5
MTEQQVEQPKKVSAPAKEQKEGVQEKVEVADAPEIKKEEIHEEPAAVVEKKKKTVSTETWHPKTELGKKVKAGEITDINEIFDKGYNIQETEIVDILLPDLEQELLLIGQSKGKFGGGQRRVFKQTQKKTKEGNKPKFATYAVVGNKNGFVGIGYGKAKETVPAREKAFRNARLNLIRIRRGSGSWESDYKAPHSIPFAVDGKCGSVHIKLMPAPRGKGLIAESECQKILKFAGIQDVWSKTKGKTSTKSNLVTACMKALYKLTNTRVQPIHVEKLSIAQGRIESEQGEEEHAESES